MRSRGVLGLVAAAVIIGLVATSTVDAQGRRGGQRGAGGQGGQRGFGGPGGQRGFGGRGGGSSLVGLLRIEEVRNEIEMVDAQMTAVTEMEEQMRGSRPQGRPDFRDMSDAEREKMFAEMRQRAEEQAKKAEAELAKILLPHQLQRLTEIQIQQQGVRALVDNTKVVAALRITAQQKATLQEMIDANSEAIREQMRGMFDAEDRDAIRAKIDDLRKQSDQKVLAQLSSEQQTAFAELKGEPFEMPERSFGGRGGGDERGGRRGGGDRGGDSGRPQRPGS